MKCHSGRIVQINLSDGGVPKQPVSEAKIEQTGLVGDRQRNLKYHGGLDRAVCLWSAEVISTLQAEGHPITPGSAGENLTIAGLPWHHVKPDMKLKLGHSQSEDTIILHITSYAPPCRTISRYFLDRRYGRISHKQHVGISRLYARVVSPGTIRVGDEIQLIPPSQ